MASPIQEADGSGSMRRILACGFAVASIALFIFAFKYASAGWYVFIPGLACLATVAILMFFTTWGDVAAIIASWKGR